VLDAYCRMLLLSKQLGGPKYFSEDKERELLELKDKLGFADPRNTKEYENCDICSNDVFRDSWSEAGVDRKAFTPPPPMTGNAPAAAGQDSEALIQAITERVIAALGNKS